MWWTIWKERNSRAFENKSNSIQKMKHNYIQFLHFWCFRIFIAVGTVFRVQIEFLILQPKPRYSLWIQMLPYEREPSLLSELGDWQSSLCFSHHRHHSFYTKKPNGQCISTLNWEMSSAFDSLLQRHAADADNVPILFLSLPNSLLYQNIKS